MNDKVCRACLQTSKDKKWYPFSSPKLVPQEECSFHPVLTNWRVVRTLKTIRSWSLEGAGATVALTATCKMPVNMGGGHVHERTARAKLFDYEGPFLDLLVQEGLLFRHKGMPITLTVSAAGDEFIRHSLMEAEIKGGVKTTAHYLPHREI